MLFLPLIGITCPEDETAGRLYLPHAYWRAVAAAGGTPVLLPPAGAAVDNLAERLDGLLLSGGGDPDPWHFGEEPRPGLGAVTPERDRFELELTRLALARGMPVLGICRGMQVLNVASGGTLLQDIPEGVPAPLKHSQNAPRWYPTHGVEIRPGTLLARILGTTGLRVNSFHHQAVRDTAPGLTVSAVAPDGVIEGLEAPGPAFVLGVQWHPEAMWEKEPVQHTLFTAFVDAARKRRNAEKSGEN